RPRLTARAEVRRAPRQADAGDRRAAARAGLAGVAVDAQLLLEGARLAGAADVVADAGAALVDGPRQHRLDGPAEAGGRAGVAAVGRAGRVQAGLRERPVGGGVADARDAGPGPQPPP